MAFPPKKSAPADEKSGGGKPSFLSRFKKKKGGGKTKPKIKSGPQMQADALERGF